jgi:hypothetical protein
MWLYIIVLALAVLALAGGALLGGVFTIVLIPIAVIVFVGAAVYRSMGAAAERREGGPEPENPPYPHSVPDQPGHVRTDPETLADARRVQQ